MKNSRMTGEYVLNYIKNQKINTQANLRDGTNTDIKRRKMERNLWLSFEWKKKTIQLIDLISFY